MEDDPDDKDDTKRKSRNLSEKKRRDQFNLLVNELSAMVSVNNRKMDKSTVLKSTIAFLTNHNEVALKSRSHEIQENWKPSFLSNEEFTHLILEALDGFIVVFSANGQIYYASESITSLLGHLPSDLLSMTIYDLANEEDHTQLYNILLQPKTKMTPPSSSPLENQISFTCYLKRGRLDENEEILYEPVHFIGHFRSDVDTDNMLPRNNNSTGSTTHSYQSDTSDNSLIFVGTGRLQTPQLIREMSIVHSSKSEFTSRHSLEWKFLFLDHRAPPIIGYLPFEVLGTSGYDYYHLDDLDKVILCHEALMQKGEGTSCYYRFLTKGQQWIWLQTRFYITYHQWNSKPEFVVCTHRVVSYADVARQYRNYCVSSMDEGTTGDAVNGKCLELMRNQKALQSLSPNSRSARDNQSDAAMSVSSENTKPLVVAMDTKVELTDIMEEPERQQSIGMLSTSPWSSRSSKSRFAVTNSPSVKRLRHRDYHNDPESDSTTSMSAESMNSRQSLMTSSSRSKNQRHGKVNHTSGGGSGSGSSRHQVHQQIPLQRTPLDTGQGPPQVLPAPFIEPPQYLTAISVQPVLATTASFTAANAAVISPIQPEMGVILTPAQTQMQDQLQRKHEHLQHMIVQQQEELRIVSEQLLMSRYGIIPPIVNVCYPTAVPPITLSPAGHHPQQGQQPLQPSHNNYGHYAVHAQSQPIVDGVHHQASSGQGIEMKYVEQQPDESTKMELEQMVPQQGSGCAGAGPSSTNGSDLGRYGRSLRESNQAEQYQMTPQGHVVFAPNVSPNTMNSRSNAGES